jgi:hypothetical protein
MRLQLGSRQITPQRLDNRKDVISGPRIGDIGCGRIMEQDDLPVVVVVEHGTRCGRRLCSPKSYSCISSNLSK